MLKNYLLITLRNFSREKSYALINILGLSLALACAIVLGLYVRSELSYDQHNVDHERIARVVAEIDTNGQSSSLAIVSPALGPLIKRQYPQAGEYVRFKSVGDGTATVLRSGAIQYSWNDVYFADSNVFEIFTHEVVYGDLQAALTDPSSIVVSESLARTYWGDTNPVGNTLETDTALYRVSAVFKDLPETSHLKYDALLPYDVLMASFGATNEDVIPGNLLVQMGFTYFKVPEGSGLQELERLLNQYYADNVEDIGGWQIGMHITYRAQPLADVHFDAGWDYDRPTGNVFYLYGFSAVALFILLVACINYTNLATARATKRAKEVGMRKVVGAQKKQLIAQFLGESLAHTAIAFCLSLALVEVLDMLTSVSSFLRMDGMLELLQDPSLILWLGLLVLGVGLASGLYPALYLSSISPNAALTAMQRDRSSRFSIRQALVLVQFFVSIAVVCCTVLMAVQMRYVSSKPLGFDRDNRLFFQLRGGEALAQLPVIRNELLSHPRVVGVAESSFIPGANTPWHSVSIESSGGQMEDAGLWTMSVSREFVDVMGMDIVQGRGFSQDAPSDAENSLIVNESLVQEMGWENPLGKRIAIRASDTEGELRVIGIVRDFHFASLRESVQPMVMHLFPPPDSPEDSSPLGPDGARSIFVQLSGEDVAEAIRHIESVVTRFDPDHPFAFRFLGDALDDLYGSDEDLMKLTAIFSAICIFISSMGLYGLSAFEAEQRTKEIGVRKVLGASNRSIVLMLAQGQSMLMGVSAVLAWIVSYLAINRWLTAFAYRADIAWWAFVVSAMLVALIAFATMAWQSFKTAQSKPVEALRYE